MPAIALLVKESLSWLIKVVTTPRNIEYNIVFIKTVISVLILHSLLIMSKLIAVAVILQH